MRADAALREARERSRRLRAAIDGIEALFPLSGIGWADRTYDPSPEDPLQAFKLDLVAQAVEAVEQATMLLLGRPLPPPARFDARSFDAAARARIADVLAADAERTAYLRLCDAVRVAADTLRPLLARDTVAHGGLPSGFPDSTTRGVPMEPGSPAA